MKTAKEIWNGYIDLREQIFESIGFLARELAADEFESVDFQEGGILVVFEQLNDNERSLVSKVEPGGVYVSDPRFDDDYWVSREEIGDMLLLEILRKLEGIKLKRGDCSHEPE